MFKFRNHYLSEAARDKRIYEIRVPVFHKTLISSQNNKLGEYLTMRSHPLIFIIILHVGSPLTYFSYFCRNTVPDISRGWSLQCLDLVKIGRRQRSKKTSKRVQQIITVEIRSYVQQTT